MLFLIYIDDIGKTVGLVCSQGQSGKCGANLNSVSCNYTREIMDTFARLALCIHQMGGGKTDKVVVCKVHSKYKIRRRRKTKPNGSCS